MAVSGVSSRVFRETFIRGNAKCHSVKILADRPKLSICENWNRKDFRQITQLHSKRQIHYRCISFQRNEERQCRNCCHKLQSALKKLHIGDKRHLHGTSSYLSLLKSSKHPTTFETVRHYATSQEGDPSASPSVDPFSIVASEMGTLARDIREKLATEETLLKTMSHYYFDGKGKTFRPLVALLMSRACNIHNNLGSSVSDSQKTVAVVAEMIHTASLVHDDVIDASDTRRGVFSLNKLHGQRLSILVGDFILSQASIALARTGNIQVLSILSGILEDLVSGEFMQLGSKEDENERFSHYLKKTYKKTASLLANTCRSVAVLAQVNEGVQEMAFQYGRNLGIAFQLIDDLLDFVSSETMMGKPTAADLKLGLATAPVLFAAQQYPQLHPMIMRRFSEEGDVETARSLVAKSDGVEQTKFLAMQHSNEAIKNLQGFSVSDSQRALIRLATILLERRN